MCVRLHLSWSLLRLFKIFNSISITSNINYMYIGIFWNQPVNLIEIYSTVALNVQRFLRERATSGGETGGKESINGRGVGITVGNGRSSRFVNERGSEMADIPGRNSVCKVMHGHESGLNVRRRTSSVLLVCPSIYLYMYVCCCCCCCWLRPRDIANLAVYHRGPRLSGLYLALLLLLRRYVGCCSCCCCCSDTERARFARATRSALFTPF